MAAVLNQPDSGGTCCDCRPGACDPCGLEVTLLCDSIPASRTKCGFSEFGAPSTPAKLYLTATASGELSRCDKKFGTINAGCIGPPASRKFTLHGTAEYDPETCVLPSGLQYDHADSNTTCGGSDFHSATNVGMDISGIPPGSSVTNLSTTQRHLNQPPFPCEGFADWTQDRVETALIELSDEYTTALLKSNAIAALPAYDNDFNDSQSASANLSAGESSYSLQRMRYKIRLTAPAPFDVRVNWNETLTPEVGSPTSVAFEEIILEGAQETTIHTRNEPATDGTYTVTGKTAVEA